jgi:hypothetical protein
VTLPTTNVVDLPIRVMANTSLTVRLEPKPAARVVVRVFAIPTNGGRIHNVGELRPHVENSSDLLRRNVPVGSYEIWAVAVEGANLFGKLGPLTPAPGEEYRIVMSEGSRVSGEVQTAAGTPIRTLLTFVPYVGAGRYVHAVQTDANGRFVVSGMPPNTRLVCPGYAPGFQTGGPGSEVVIQLKQSE